VKEYRTLLIYSNELEMEKRVYVYAPEGNDNARYPVLYMHDGQNLFDDFTAYMNRGWRLLNLLMQENALKIIVVGIQSDGKTRNDHLIPYRFTLKKGAKQVGGKADLYLDFIVNTVKPIIDERFPTKKEPKYTAMMGSSFGGVNTIYAALTRNNVFSRFASLSGAFQFAFFDSLCELVKSADLSGVKHIYMDTGTKESDNPNFNKKYIDRNKVLKNLLEERLGPEKVTLKVIEGGIHHEKDWESRFLDILHKIFED
jgi:predicted alpha/beta superfamily hydrolase